MGNRSRARRTDRRAPSRSPARRFLIVCEGRSETAYFDFVRRSLRSRGIVIESVTGKHSAPLSIVTTAAHKRTGDPRLGTRDDQYDDVWVVFDTDDRPEEVAMAITEAERLNIDVALSNPSFELWLLWHLRDYMSHCVPTDLDRALSARWSSYKKGAPFDGSPIIGGLTDAMNRAGNARKLHAKNGNGFPENCPSTDLDLLLRSILDAWHEFVGSATHPL